MTRDYRHGAPAARPSRARDTRRGTCAFWFLFGALLGAFGVGYAWMTRDTPALAGSEPPPPAKPVAPPPTFDFYERLTREEVMVPVDSPAGVSPAPPLASVKPATATKASPVAPAESLSAAAAVKPAPAAATKAVPVAPVKPAPAADAKPAPPAGGYQVQIASVRDPKEAERLKAELALRGVRVEVQSTYLGGVLSYRVRTNAQDKADAESLRARLAANGYRGMLVRAK